MTPRPPLSPAATTALALTCAALGACQPATQPAALWSGYAEGEFVYLAAPVAGRLQQLAVQAGQPVAQGAPLFTLDVAPERAALDAATAQLQAAQAQAANLQSGRRPDEVAAIEAQLAQAQALATRTQADARRMAALVTQAAVSRSEADAARAAATQAAQRVTELQAQLRTARLPARPDERAAAQAQARAAASALAQQGWRVREAQQSAPTDAQVSDTFFRPGEWVAAGQPVVALLPPGQVKARFFVPQAELASLRPGEAVRLLCDGCGAPMAARVTRIASEAEYTPPVIYSNAQRNKLVFMVEAQPAPADAARLRPGQPLDVRRPTAQEASQGG